VLALSLKKCAAENLLGTRTVNEDGTLGDHAWKTCKQAGEMAEAFAKGLQVACPWLKDGGKVGFYR
jgi:hypothetical protein